MKKFLSMVLALVMAMSLVTISAGAADFTDTDSIDYLEAVEVMTAVGVVDGYTDGSFGPDAYLTRGAAAKIICNLILGPTTAGALVADAAPYSDVAADNVFAGYIAYCQKEGIISGYADGTFRPGNSLTGYAFMKMLLGALGYKAEVEGYTGNNWSINVAKQAINLGLNKGLAEEFNGVKTVTRQEALLYAFNTMKATMVEYANDSTISVGDVTVTTKSDAKEVTVSTSVAGYNNNYDGKLQFCEKYFSKLKSYNTEDALTRPATQWKNNGKEIGKYSKTADLVYTSTPSAYAVRTALGLSNTETPWFYVSYQYENEYYGTQQNLDSTDGNYYIDGSLSSAYGSYMKQLVYKSSTQASGSANSLNNVLFGLNSNVYPTGRGVTIEIFYDEEATAAGNHKNNKVVAYDEVFGKINKVGKDDGGRYVTVNNGLSGWKFYTDEFAKGDYVNYVWGADAQYGIVSMSAAEMITGTVTWLTDSNDSWNFYVQIDGVPYYNHGDQSIAVELGNEVNVWLDSNGYIQACEVTDFSSNLGSLVLIEETTTNLWNTYGKAIYGDGKTETVILDDAATSLNTIYRYTTSSGKLKVVAGGDYTSYYKNVADNYSFTKGSTVITDDTDADINVDAATGFVIIDNADNTVKAYTGYQNAPAFDNVDSIAIYKKSDAKAAALVYVWIDGNSTVSFTESDLVYVIADTAYRYKTMNSDGEEIYYFYMRTLDGGNLMVDGDTYTEIQAYTNAGVAAYNALTKDDNGIVDYGTIEQTDAVYITSDVTVEAKNGVLYIAGVGVAYADDAECYVIAYNGDSFDTDDITTLDNTYAGATVVFNNDGEVVTLVLKDKTPA